MLTLSRDQIAGMDKHAIEEIVLKQVDNDAARIRLKLHNRQLSTLTAEERCAWVRFIMSLRIRNPTVVQNLITDSDKTLRHSLGQCPEYFEQIVGSSNQSTLEAWTEAHFPGLIENFGLSIYANLLNDEAIGNKLLQLKWWIFDLSSSPNPLLLGDQPCIFFGGIDHPDLAVLLPIAPDRLFIASRGQNLEQGLPKISAKEMTKIVNEATIKQATTYVYGRNAMSKRFVEKRRPKGWRAKFRGARGDHPLAPSPDSAKTQ